MINPQHLKQNLTQKQPQSSGSLSFAWHKCKFVKLNRADVKLLEET
jgi:hypothetical protein